MTRRIPAREAYPAFLEYLWGRLIDETNRPPELQSVIREARIIFRNGYGHILKFNLPGGRTFSLAFRQAAGNSQIKQFCLELPGIDLEKSVQGLPPGERHGDSVRTPWGQGVWEYGRLYDRAVRDRLFTFALSCVLFAWKFLMKETPDGME